MVKKNKATRWQRTTVNGHILLWNSVTLIPGTLHRMLQVWLAHTPELSMLIQGYCTVFLNFGSLPSHS